MSANDLPIPDFDHLRPGDIATRIRSLSAAQVVTVMESRLAGLADGAEPSGGDPAATGADAPPPAAGGSQVSEATSGPPINPPSQGDPTNPRATG